jgi:hypothetical protein
MEEIRRESTRSGGWTNRQFAEWSVVFNRCCELASVAIGRKVAPTSRQVSKWRAGRGVARRFLRLALAQLESEQRAASGK